MKATYYEKIADESHHIRFVYENNKAGSKRIGFAHFHKSVEIIYVVSGEHTACVNGTVINLQQDDIIITNSYDVHYYTYNKENEIFVIVIGKEFLNAFSNYFGDKLFKNWLNNRTENKQILRFIQEWYKGFKKENLLINSGFINIILGLLTSIYDFNTGKAERQPALALKMLKYLDENFKNDVTLKDLAAYMGYSNAYCSQLFSQTVGVDLRSYLNNLRIMYAAKMIADRKMENKNILQISMESGFKSLNTFYRVFKNKFGKAPSEMRNNDKKLYRRK